MAFGTGTHPTTALCLAAISEAVTARPGLSVLDVGTGSGLLAIAARKLGAGRTVAVDVDPVAVRVAGENAARNGVALELSGAPAGEVRGAFDLVVANILANTLVELAPALDARLAPGGTLVLSGILAPQADEVRAAHVARGLRPAPPRERREGEWVALVLEKAAAP
jgi:ribosomal protein L11 methyltransferase